MAAHRSAPSDWLTRQQVADLAQVHLNTVKSWIANGELDVIKIGRTVRITPEALADLEYRRTQRALDNAPGARRRRLRRQEAS